MRLVVLAGGFGTRLQSAVSRHPKALAPIGSVPFLELQLQNWLAQGVSAFTFLLHHQSEQIVSFLESKQFTLMDGCHVDWIVEGVPLGTGGAIANAVQKLNLSGDFLATNADTWLSAGVHDLIHAPSPALAAVNLRDPSRYGRVEFGADLKITRFTEKSDSTYNGWINAGLCKLSASLFSEWDSSPFSVEQTLLPALARDGELCAVPLETDFIDIGVPVDYFRFCDWISDKRFNRLTPYES